MRANELGLPVRLRRGSPLPRVGRRGADPPARPRRGRPCTSRSASGVRSESRLKVARRTTTRMSSRSSACGEFGGDQSAQPPQPGGCRALPAHLAVERMRHPHFDAAVDVVEGDQATGVGLLDGGRIGDPSSAPPARSARRRPARRSRRRLAAGRAPMRDSISSTRPGGMIGSPIHRQYPCCFSSRPSATSCSTMLRRYRTLPRVSFHSR